jgi:hypothetical protein
MMPPRRFLAVGQRFLHSTYLIATSFRVRTLPSMADLDASTPRVFIARHGKDFAAYAHSLIDLN